MNYFAKLIVFYPKITIALVLLVTAALSAAIVWRGIDFDGSPKSLARNDSSLEFFNEASSIFGDDRVIIVALTTDDIFTPRFIQKLERLTQRLSGIRGVSEVLSLTSLKTVRRNNTGLLIERLIPKAATFDELVALKRTVSDDPLYSRQYISKDGRTTALSVFLEPLEEAHRRDIAEQVEQIAKSESNGDEVLLAGVPIMDARGIRNMVREDRKSVVYMSALFVSLWTS